MNADASSATSENEQIEMQDDDFETIFQNWNIPKPELSKIKKEFNSWNHIINQPYEHVLDVLDEKLNVSTSTLSAMKCALYKINYNNENKECVSSAAPLNFYLYNRKLRDELHNNKKKYIRNRLSRLLKHFTASFTNN